MKHTINHRPVPRETFDSVAALYNDFRSHFEAYVDQLFWWNERINLVSRDVPRETIAEHIKHSLLLHAFECFIKSEVVVDAGTGGGLPGIPLSIINPQKRFLLNDIVSKKVLAVKQIAKKLSLGNIHTADKSIGNLSIDTPFLLISKHAFKIDALYQMTEHLPWTEMVFYKGIDFKDELDDIDHPLSISVYDLSRNSKNNFYKDKALVVLSQ